MTEKKFRFIKRVQRTSNVYSFRFENDPQLDFIPGQFGQLIFDEQDRSNKQLNKYLSFSCAPQCPYLEFTKKISTSDFSQRLMKVREGESILIKAPMGNCTLKGDEGKIGFLAGGIGITPAISIIEHLVKTQVKLDTFLLYSNWTSSDIAFRSELDEWASSNLNIRIKHVLVDKKPDDSECCSGMITKDFIVQQMPDFQERVLFIFGPPSMVKAMQELCAVLECSREKIKAENFLGY